MFARGAFRAAPALRSSFRQYSSKNAQEPLQANAGRQIAIAGVAGLAGYYAYSTLGGSAKLAAKQEAAPVAAPKVFTGGDQGFVSLKLEEVENINHNTKRFRFSFEDPNSVSGLTIASALLTKYQQEGQKPVVRPYTPTSDEDTKGYLDLMVKHYPNGPMSTHLHEMKPGQRLDFKGPLPKYQWSENKHEHIAFIAGGTGITPMFQIARAIFNNPKDKTKVSLIFGNVSEADILLKKEFEELENEYPNRFKAFYVLDQAPKDYTGRYQTGFITKDLLKTVLPAPSGGDAVKVFVCGPPGLYKAISGGKKSPADQGELTGYLQELGYTKDQVFKF
ncbi:ferredoxin reductase-like protein [Microthyrium microscopicum]|uniref:NADH-cytochrome b5 reductase n=1 Tax=Microthyrium microscopicum TaxID=703497 RepID=A0A6A6U5X7_9PEZI|nr:ferredoxin reductase-like protein [Microthyrium microscopicum]